MYLRGVVLTMTVLFALVGVGLGCAAAVMYMGLGYVVTPVHKVPSFAAPRLQIDATRDLEQLREREMKRLHGEAAMPIDEAIEAIAARGARAYAPLDRPEESRGSQ